VVDVAKTDHTHDGSTRQFHASDGLSRALLANLPGTGLVVVDRDLRIVSAEGDGYRGHNLLGYAGRLVGDVLPAVEWEILLPRCQAALRGQVQSFEHRAVVQPTSHALQLTPLREGGEVVAVMVFIQDITHETAVRDALRGSELRHSAVLEALAEGVIVTDLGGRLLDANAAACSMLGIDLASAIDDPGWWEPLGAHLVGDEVSLANSGLGAKVLATGRGLRDIAVAAERPDGTALTLSMNYLPWRDRSDQIGGLVLSFADVTSSALEHRRLVRTEEHLRDAHEVAQLASWQWNPADDTVTVFQAMTGDPTEVGPDLGLDELLGALPAEDKEAARDDLAAIVRGERDDSVRRFCLPLPDGPAWMELRGRAVRDDEGRLVCVRGTSQDVTEQEEAARGIAAARDFFQATLDSMPAHIAVLDEAGQILRTNRAWDEFALANGGTAPGAGDNYFAACDAAPHDESAVVAATGLRAIAAGTHEDFSMEYPCHSATAERWFVLHAARYEGPGRARVVVAHDDVTARHQAEAKSATQAALLDEVDVAVIAADLAARITHWNSAAEQLYGWTREEAVGRTTYDLISRADDPAVSEALTALERDGRWDGELELHRKDGVAFRAHVRSRLMLDDAGEPVGMTGVSVDATKRIADERDLRSARDYMRAVADSMGDGLCTVDSKGRIFYVNPRAEELLGWTRDELAGQDLHAALHHTRADGSPYPAEECPMVEARRTRVPALVDDDVLISRSGALLPVRQVQTPFETDDGVGGFVLVFSDISARKRLERDAEQKLHDLAWIELIRDALDHDRFVLYAQPIVDIRTGAIVQHELLIRMLDEADRPIAPGLFLPVAESYGSIGEIDRWVARETVRLAAVGHAVEMNVSAHSLSDPTFYDFVEGELRRSAADPGLIVVELTETALVQDQAASENFARRIHALGCKLALDDFGTGYGGFTYLKQLPIDYLKIDIEFVRDLATNPASRLVVEAVVALARGFDLRTVAEGVEDARTLDLLREYGVDYAQGYHLGYPARLSDTLDMKRPDPR
jgi:PAS domain S-box-containing protein